MPTLNAPAEEVKNVKYRSEEELQMIKSFQVPEFIPPYPSKINFHAQNAIDKAQSWREEYKLFKLYRESTLPTLYDTNAANLATRVYIDADETELTWACKFYIWTFVLDDQLDDREYFQNPEKSVALYLELNLVLLWSFPDDPTLLSTLKQFIDKATPETRQAHVNYVEAKLAEARKSPGTVYDASESGVFCIALQNLWMTLLQAKSPEYCLRWAIFVQNYLIGNADETVVRKENHIPSIAEFIPNRRKSVCADTMMVVIEYVDKVDVPDELFKTPEMEELLLAITDVVAWHNDLWSFKKELLVGDVFNLVYLVSLERNCSYVEAGKIALQMMLDRIDEMERACAALLHITPPQHKPAVQRYTKTCQSFVSGVQDWHMGNKRYNF